MASGFLQRLRILIVEDEPIIALDIGETLLRAGATVVGPAHSVARALKLVRSNNIDAAVLDYRLEKETAAPIAQLLLASDIPFLFHTSSGATPSYEYPQVRILHKPTQPELLVREIRALISS